MRSSLKAFLKNAEQNKDLEGVPRLPTSPCYC